MESKILGVKDCVKTIREDIKIAKEISEKAEKDFSNFGGYADCGDFYKEEVIRAKQHLDTLVSMKIKLEKYGKKLGHELEERYAQDPFVSREKTKERWRNEFQRYGSLIIAYDFDYTVHSYKDEDYTYELVVNLLREWRPYAKYIVFSASPEVRFSYMKGYLKEKNIPFDTINDEILERNYTRKVYYNVFLDDRAGLGEVVEILYELLDELKNGSLVFDANSKNYSYFGGLSEKEKEIVDNCRQRGLSDKEIKKALKDEIM